MTKRNDKVGERAAAAAKARAAGEQAELQRQGAKAAARGERSSVNPLNEPGNRPASTGESTEVWLARRAAWHHGHDAESGARGDAPGRPTEPDDEHS